MRSALVYTLIFLICAGWIAHRVAFDPVARIITPIATQIGFTPQHTEYTHTPSQLPNVFTDPTRRFSIRYPGDSTAHNDHTYEIHTGDDKTVTAAGVRFTVPESFLQSTNLGLDTYLSVEELPLSQDGTCAARMFLDTQGVTDEHTETITATHITYSVASLMDAGAGNRYEETVYATPTSYACVGVRYFVHYSAIENYEPGVVHEFDAAALRALFDSMRDSLIFE